MSQMLHFRLESDLWNSGLEGGNRNLEKRLEWKAQVL